MGEAHRETAPPALDEDGKMPDTGPVLDAGGGSIDEERADAGVEEEPKRGAPPETELPPD